jgi:hypothetical protein
MSKSGMNVCGVDIAVTGRLVRIVRLKDELYTSAPDPVEIQKQMRQAGIGADILSFVQDLDDAQPKYGYLREDEAFAVLRLTTFDHWYNKQLRCKARNTLRKAAGSDLETRVIEFSDELLHGIKAIYSDMPIVQGKRNWHYGKDLDTLRREHATFLDCSEFVGAYIGGELIGFAKVTHLKTYSIIMNLVAKVAYRDRAPSNALLARVVELTAARGTQLLNYGVWGRRGLNLFKTANAFERLTVPRYYVPLTLRGRVALRLGLHLSLKERLPESWIVRAADARARWNNWRFSSRDKHVSVPTPRLVGSKLARTQKDA